MENKIIEGNYEQDYETCPYAQECYYESDTGYREFRCLLFEEDLCDEYCPLSYKYRITKD